MINIRATGIHKDDKSIIEINISVSDPYWITEGEEAACEVKLAPLYENLVPIIGSDPLQALQLATEFAYVLMTASSDEYDFTYHSKE